MSAHTPGPWQVKSGMEPEYIVGDIDGPLEGNEMHYSPVAIVMETKQFEANARLIAAAPELLEALQTIAFMRGADSSKTMLDLAHIAYESFHIARAIIAKATGTA